ncbi:MAG: permease [Actinomycetota bacterium]|nr:permease [Actinomycetota bacterium]
MAQAAAPRTSESWRLGGLMLAGLVALGFALSVFEPTQIPGLQNFLLVFGSLLIEAVPFVLLGAVVSAAIEVFVPPRVFERLTALPRPFQLPAAGLAGFAFPVCECGSVPVARRLASKGLSPAAAVTFMLAAPILNPVVVVSTVVAYRGRDTLLPMVLGRLGLGLLAAMAVGWVVSNRRPEELLRARPEDDHSHEHGDDSKARSFFGHLAGDFVFMGRFLVIGAIVAAALQTFVPQSVIGSVAETPVVALVAMMALAFVLSLCSESDAFVAASFVQFGVGAQLAFLVFGPMVDTKLGILYSATFSKGFFRTVVIAVAAVTLAGTLWIEVLVG